MRTLQALLKTAGDMDLIAPEGSGKTSLISQLCAAALPELNGPGFKDKLFGHIIDSSTVMAGRRIDDLYSSMLLNKGNCTMRQFCGKHPAEGVSLETHTGRTFVVAQAVEDSGCTPNIISAAAAKAYGISIRNLKPSELPNIRNIEGDAGKRLTRVTEPLTVILAKGSYNEVRLEVPEGFLVMDGDSAAEMYDIVLGTDLLLEVSGTTVPLTSSFHYVVRKGDGFKWARLPVRIGRGSLLGAPKPSLGFLCVLWCRSLHLHPSSQVLRRLSATTTPLRNQEALVLAPASHMSMSLHHLTVLHLVSASPMMLHPSTGQSSGLSCLSPGCSGLH